MISRLLPAAVALLYAGSPALADDFDGPFVQAGVGLSHANADIGFTGWFRDKAGHTGEIGSVSAGYGLSFGRFGLAASVSRVIGHQNAGATEQDSPFVPEEQDDRVAVRLRNVWTLGLEPGLRVGAHDQVYARLGYSRADGRWTFTRPLFADRFTGHMRFHGFSLGGGYRHGLGSRRFAFVEAQRTWYPRRTVPVTITTEQVTSTYQDRFGAGSATVVAGFGTRF